MIYGLLAKSRDEGSRETVMINKKECIGHLCCFVAYAIFGVNVVTCKDLTNSHILSPIALFTLRAIGAGTLFWIISAFTPKEKVAKKDFPKIILASLLGFFLTQFTFLAAIPQITPMTCSILSALTPIYTMFIAAVAVKEPITPQKAGGVLISFAGIVFLILNSNGSGAGADSNSLSGVLLMIANGICFAMYLGMFRPLIQKYSVVTFMKWIFLFAALMTLPFSASELVYFDWTLLAGRLGLDLFILIFCATFISYFLIPIGQKNIRPTLVSMYNYFQPLIATTISIIIGMDTLGWQKIVAATAILGGVILVSFSKKAPVVK